MPTSYGGYSDDLLRRLREIQQSELENLPGPPYPWRDFTTSRGSIPDYIRQSMETLNRDITSNVPREERAMPVTNASVQEGTDATVMILREKCMSYFKSSPAVLHGGNTGWFNVPCGGSRHFERDEDNLKGKLCITLDRETILTLERHPDTLTLHMGILDRSKTMRDVQAGIRHYMHKWLPAVKLAETPEGSPSEWRKDRGTVAYNAQVDSRPARHMNFSIYEPEYVTINTTSSITVDDDDVEDYLLPF